MTQLLTLHWALEWDHESLHPSRYEVYIDTLPEDFRPWQPLYRASKLAGESFQGKGMEEETDDCV